MFTNATLLEFYARARRDEDLLVLAHRHPVEWKIDLRELLHRLMPHAAPTPVPVRVQPRRDTR